VVLSNTGSAQAPWMAAKNLDTETEPFEAEFNEDEHEAGDFEDLMGQSNYDEFEYDEYELEPLDLDKVDGHIKDEHEDDDEYEAASGQQ